MLAEVAHPFFSFDPLSPRGLPQVWTEGEHPVAASVLWGTIPVGEQVIDIRFRERGDVRIVEDDGGPVSGPLAVVTGWRHRMAVSADRGRTHPLPRPARHLGRRPDPDRVDRGLGVLAVARVPAQPARTALACRR